MKLTKPQINLLLDVATNPSLPVTLIGPKIVTGHVLITYGLLAETTDGARAVVPTAAGFAALSDYV